MTRLSDVAGGETVNGALKICSHPHDKARCGAEAPTGKICTEPDGHDGFHVACGVATHQYVVWDDDDNVRDEYDEFRKRFDNALKRDDAIFGGPP